MTASAPAGAKHRISPSDLRALRPSDPRTTAAAPLRPRGKSLAAAVPPPTECLRKAPLYEQHGHKEAQRKNIVKKESSTAFNRSTGHLASRPSRIVRMP